MLPERRLTCQYRLEDIDEQRQDHYSEMLEPIISASVREGLTELNEARIKIFLLLLISSVNERTLFGDLNPARSLQMDEEAFTSELTTALHGYLCTEAVPTV